MDSSEFDKARKVFRMLGITVGVLGLLSLIMVGNARGDLESLTYAAVGLCVITGILLLAVPSVGSGIAAGVSLLILGGVDLKLAGKADGFAFLAPLVDIGFAIRVFIGCYVFARAAAAARPGTDGR